MMLDGGLIVDYAAAAGASFIAGFIGGLSGLGGGIIIAAAAAPIFGIKATVPLLSVYALLNNISRIYFFRGSLDVRIVTLLLIAATPMTFLGAAIYERLDAATVALVLGLTLVASGPIRAAWQRRGLRIGDQGLVAAGSVIGLIGTTTVGMGALIMPVLLGAGVVGSALIAARSVIGLGLGLAKVAAFGAFNLLTWNLVLGGILMGLCAVPDAGIAAWIVKRTDSASHNLRGPAPGRVRNRIHP